ncbi:hypothetical protein [Desmonostoc muscorum]
MPLYFLSFVEALHGSALVEALRGSYCHQVVQVTSLAINVEISLTPY